MVQQKDMSFVCHVSLFTNMSIAVLFYVPGRQLEIIALCDFILGELKQFELK